MEKIVEKPKTTPPRQRGSHEKRGQIECPLLITLEGAANGNGIEQHIREQTNFGCPGMLSLEGLDFRKIGADQV